MGVLLCSVPPLKMPEHKMARAAQQQQSLASGTAFGDYINEQRDVAPLFATKLRRKTMITAITLGLVAFVLLPCAVETKAILASESSESGPQVYEFAP
jgi:hypothetical protein